MSRQVQSPIILAATLPPVVLLAAAALAFWFTSPHQSLAPAAWLAPVLLVRFLRSRRPLTGLVVGWLITGLVLYFANLDFMPLPLPIQAGLAVIAALFGMLPYLADRLVVRRDSGFATTLVLPSAGTALEYAAASQYVGTINSIAYKQASLLPLVQSASVFSIWGIIFLLYWTASAVNWAWDRGFAWPRVRWGVGIFTGVLVVMLAFGAARLVLAPAPAQTVRVAMISADPLRIGTAAYTAHTGEEMTVGPEISLISPELSAMQDALNAFIAQPDDPRFAPVHDEFVRLHDDLFALTRHEARTGARIVAWAEGNAYVLTPDEPALVERGRHLARAEEIYLFMPLASYAPGAQVFGQPGTVENKIVAIGPDGAILATYYKTKLPPGDPSIVGDGVIPVLETPYGKIALAICSDLDSPEYVAQVGRATADVLIAPASDWQAIAMRHADSARLRAVENGVTLVRPTLRGHSIVSDAYGRIQATQNWFTAEEHVMAVTIPVGASNTLYPQAGDVVAWLSAAGLLSVGVVALIIRVRCRLRGPAEPVGPMHA